MLKNVYVVPNGLNYKLNVLTVVKTSELLSKTTGSTLARLITFIVCIIKQHPNYIGIFHILFNSTLSILFANMFNCRSIYFSVGRDKKNVSGRKKIVFPNF